MTGGPRASTPQNEVVLECVVNVSEGRDAALLAQLAAACGDSLLDVHSDPAHNRSVLTLGGPRGSVEPAARNLTAIAHALFDLGPHIGAHPRFGVVDVVPFVELEGWPLRDAATPGSLARQARDSFAEWAASELGMPVFLYGPERSLPEVRRRAWRDLLPDCGPPSPHPTAGSVAVGCRRLMIAYNLWLAGTELARARAIAAALRCPEVRALAFDLPGGVQVSLNLIEPLLVGPQQAWDLVAGMAPIARAELVGLVPASVLDKTPPGRWAELDLSPERTIEHRLARRR